MKLVIFFLISYFLTACSTKKEPFADHRFYAEAEKYFSNDQYVVSSTSLKGNFSVFQLEANKTLLTREKLYALKAALKKGGWAYNYDIDGYYWLYCRDSKNESLRIYFPNERVVKTQSGTYLDAGLNDEVVHIIFAQYKNKNDNFRFTACAGS